MRILALLLALSFPALAGDFQTWLGGYADLPIGENWRGFVEVQNRFSQNSTSEQRLLVRGAVGLRIGQSHSLWAGYGWTPVFNPGFQDEHRFYQQWMTERVWDHWTLTARFEQMDAVNKSLKGTFYLSRPGRLKFEYDPPAPFLIVANGSSLIYEDATTQQATRLRWKNGRKQVVERVS